MSTTEAGTTCHSKDLLIPDQVAADVQGVTSVGRLRFVEATFEPSTHNTSAFKTYMENIIVQSTGVDVTVFNVREGSVVVDFASAQNVSADKGAFTEDAARVAEAMHSEGDTYQLGKQIVAAAEPYVPPPTAAPTTSTPTMAPVETSGANSTDEPVETPTDKESSTAIVAGSVCAGLVLAGGMVAYARHTSVRTGGRVTYNQVEF